MIGLERSLGAKARTRRELFTFGGVTFEVLADQPWRLPEAFVRYCMPNTDTRAIAHVICAVRVDPALPQSVDWLRNEVRFTQENAPHDALCLRGRALVGQLQSLGAQRYAVSVRVAADEDGYLALLRGVSAAILQREGGLVLHAAALELDGKAMLFVGPSGAGKSTALRLTEDARCFADDHVALVPHRGGWIAWGLPGGTPAVAVLRSRDVAYPLAAVLRVRRGARDAAPQTTLLRGASALFAVRESVEWADDSPSAEDSYLRAVMELSSQVTIARVETVLDKPLRPVLDALPSATSSPRGLRS